MREAMIICPQQNNAGQSMQHVERYAVRSMCAAFGGCTVTNAKESWVNSRGELIQESVWELTSACDVSGDNARKLETIARYIGTEAEQEAVYVRYAGGDGSVGDTLTMAAHEWCELALYRGDDGRLYLA